MLESIDASNEQLRSIFSSKSFKTKSTLRYVSLLVQTSNRPSLHMAYVRINKLEHDLNRTDVHENGEIISIDDRQEGNTERDESSIHSFFFRHRIVSKTSWIVITVQVFIRR